MYIFVSKLKTFSQNSNNNKYKKMKAIFCLISLIIIMLIININLVAQSTPSGHYVIKFGYDEAGNRKWRDVVFLEDRSHQIIDTTTSQISDSIMANSIAENPFTNTTNNEGQTTGTNAHITSQNAPVITIYPNPTTGHLLVKTTPFNSSAPGEITVFDMQSHLIIKEAFNKELTMVDLSKYSKGSYILKVRIGNMESEWKVVKE